MTTEYVWGLQPWEQGLLWIGGIFTYVICMGFTRALTSERWQAASRDAAAMIWPFTLVGYLVYSAARIGPRAVAYRKERNKLPRAKVRQ